MKLNDIVKLSFDSLFVVGWWDGPHDPSEDIAWDGREREEAIPKYLLEAEVMLIEAWEELVIFVAVKGDFLPEEFDEED